MAAFTNTVFADELDDINNQKDEKLDEKAGKQGDLKTVNYQITSASNAIYYVADRINTIETELAQLAMDKITLEDSIAALELQIGDLSHEFETQYTEYKTLISELYKLVAEDEESLIYFSTDFSDFETIAYFENIEAGLYRKITEIEDQLSWVLSAKIQLDADKETLLQKEVEYLSLSEELATQKIQYQNFLNAQKQAQVQLLADLKDIDSEIASLDIAAQRIIAAKYASVNPGSSSGGSFPKPVTSGNAYFKVTITNASGTSIYDSYVQGPVRVSSVSPLEIASDAGFSYGKYRGTLEARGDTNVYLINELPLEQYIRGLSEMSAWWGTNGGMEALKSQAIIGKSYAIANLGKRANYNFDLYDNTSDQAYRGYIKEIENYGNYWTSAVDAVNGKVLTYAGAVIAPYYHSNSGGHTLSSQEVWGGFRGFVQAESDWYYENGSLRAPLNYYTYWCAGCSTSGGVVHSGLNSSNIIPIIDYGISYCGLGSGITSKVGTITGMQHFYDTGGTTIQSNTKYTTTLRITGTAGTYDMPADCFRIGYNVQASGNLAIWTKLWDVVNQNGEFLFWTRGFGHRVGLSQYGAYYYSMIGQSYNQILSHYYRGTLVSDYNTNISIRIGLTVAPSEYYLLLSNSGTVTVGGTTIANVGAGYRVYIVELQ